MLVVFDKTSGRIHQVVTYAASGLKAIRKMHNKNGDGTLTVAKSVDIASAYVCGGRIEPRPTVAAAILDAREIRADGVDALQLEIGQPCDLEVTFQGEVVAAQSVASGQMPLSVEQPGEYRLKFTAEFPYLDTEFTVRAA